MAEMGAHTLVDHGLDQRGGLGQWDSKKLASQHSELTMFLGRPRGYQLPAVESTHCRVYFGRAPRKADHHRRNGALDTDTHN